MSFDRQELVAMNTRLGRFLPLAAIVAMVASLVVLLYFLAASLTQVSAPPGSTTIASAPASGMSIPNPGFESKMDNWQPQYTGVGAIPPNDEYSVELDTLNHHTGTASAVIKSKATKPTESGHINTKISAESARGKRIRYSAYVKAENVVGWTGLRMHVYGILPGKTEPEDLPMSWDIMFDPGIKGTVDWRKYEIVLDVPREATLITFGLQLSGTGTAWLDDVQMEFVGDDVPTTDMAGVKKLDNLNFENGLTDWSFYTSGQTPATSAYTIGTGLKMAHTGKDGVYLRSLANPTPRPSEFAVLSSYSIYAGYYQGKTVRLTAYINVDHAIGRVSMLLASPIDDEEGRPTSPYKETTIQGRGRIANNLIAPGENGWQRYHVDLPISEKAAFMSFQLRFYGQGEIWIDDVQLEAVSSP